MKAINNTIINSIMRTYIKHLCAILLLFGMSANAWGMSTSDIESSAATTITDGASYVIATAYNGSYLTADAYNDWAPVTADINNAAIFTAHGSASGFYLTSVYGTMAVGASGKFVAYNNATTNNLQLSASGQIQSLANSVINLRSNSGTPGGGRWYNGTTGSSLYLFKITTKFTITYNAGSGTCGTPSETQSVAGAPLTLPSASPSAGCTAEGWVFAGWKQTSAQSETTSIPTLYPAGSKYWPHSSETLYAVYRLGDVYTIDFESTSSTYTAWTFTRITSQGTDVYVNAHGSYIGLTTSTNPNSVVTKSKIESPKAISFKVSKTTTNTTTSTWQVYTSTDGSTWTSRKSQDAKSMYIGQWIDVSQDLSSYGDVYVKIEYNSSGAVRAIDDVILSCATYYSNPSCAACAASPSVEGAEFESISSGTISVSCDGITNGTGCATEEYGFVWKTGASAPTSTSDGTNVKVGEGSGGDAGFSTDLSISFTTGTTYQIVAYATNAAGTTLGNAVAVTPRSVTFNSNGGSEVATQYVNSGGTVSAPSDPTKSGFVFGGWYQESGLSTPVDWSAAITADMTYYAKWLTYSDYVFSCAELTLTAYPETADAPIFITSVAGKKVRSQGYIQITGSGLTPSTTLTFPDLNSKFEIKTAAYGDLATDATGAIDVAAYIFYTPDAGATSDGLDKIAGISVSVGGAKPKQVSLVQSIIGRHLPADFVIAGKKDGKWYALPSNMESTDHPAPAEIAVDNATNPAIAYTDASNKYGLEGPTTGPSGNIKSGVGQYVKLTMHPLSDAPLFGMAPSNTAIGKSGTAVATHDLSAGYWWQLKQTNTSITNPQDAKYTIYCANNTSSLSIKDNAGSPEWGLYASGIEELRLIPASSIVFAEAEIVEWGQHGAIIEVDATAISANKVKAILNEAESAIVAASQTGTSVKGSSTKYNYTAAFGDGIDFAAATSNGAMLTLEWYNNSSVLVGVSNINVPKIIAANATMSSIASGDAAWSSAEVHVLPGMTLEANAGSFLSRDVTIDQLEIYPGATVQVTTGTLDVRKLVLRNGWKRIGGTAYNTAHLYIADDANLTKTNAVDIWYSDWYIDYDQYYPIAVPWDVTVANMSYKNTKNAASAGVKLLYYDGESRADNAQTGVGDGANWKEYGADGNKPKPTTLKPGMGYAMTARRPTGKAFSIVRLPMSFSNAWGADGEQGEVGGAHKDQVAVIAYGVGAEPAKPTYLVGWNFIANPYMANYQGTIEYADGDKINVVNIPDVSFNEYGQYATATTKLAPASGFLIQAPKDGTLTFGSANRKNAAPGILKTKQADAVPEQQAYILLKNESAEDMMGLFVSEKYTADYDLNGDVEKLLSSGTSLRTYMHFGDMDMAYVAINEALAKEWIPVTIRIPEAGEYAFSIHEASIAGELEGVYLIDYENGDKVTNLLEENYPFYSEAGTASGRFAINAVIGKRVPTDIDAVNAGTDSTKPVKFIYRENVYILHHGAIYDATGKKVREINK